MLTFKEDNDQPDPVLSQRWERGTGDNTSGVTSPNFQASSGLRERGRDGVLADRAESRPQFYYESSEY